VPADINGLRHGNARRAGLAIRGWAPKPVRLNLIAAGAASGIMGTATSIGGLPMALAALQP